MNWWLLEYESTASTKNSLKPDYSNGPQKLLNVTWAECGRLLFADFRTFCESNVWWFTLYSIFALFHCSLCQLMSSYGYCFSVLILPLRAGHSSETAKLSRPCGKDLRLQLKRRNEYGSFQVGIISRLNSTTWDHRFIQPRKCSLPYQSRGSYRTQI